MPDPRPSVPHRGALALAALALLLCWIPWAGLAISLAALALSYRVRRRGAGKVAWAVALGVWALLLGLFFTGVVVVYPPARTTPEDHEAWEAFERSFEGPGGGGEDDAGAAGGEGRDAHDAGAPGARGSDEGGAGETGRAGGREGP